MTISVEAAGGSPPRARGRREQRRGGRAVQRFTPAGAGTATTGPRPGAPSAVHPRGRGDGQDEDRKREDRLGSPPRARGRQRVPGRSLLAPRFTPAGAGTARSQGASACTTAVHPRGRGDGTARPIASASHDGSPPRARGRRRARAWRRRPYPVHPRGRGDGRRDAGGAGVLVGSPPRARGRRPGRSRRACQGRFTPAGAGTACVAIWAISLLTVHPRGRGDGTYYAAQGMITPGSPPRARGRQPRAQRSLGYRRFTPAGAGTALKALINALLEAVHPRGRGDGVCE